MVAYDTYSSDDEEEQCPLCIEDMDITDKHFKPCPCGFQICQFCYNSIRSGPEQYNRCPACRRPYDDASIEYKKFSPEDLKREQERKQRKEAERKQREREKLKDQQHHDSRDKKHLASMRVIQKNLVYVIGLNPSIPSEDLQSMLRRDEFFGQYGKIQKIVVNKRVNGNGNPGVGVYVTFARKEDAARCIAAVDGSMNDGKYLRAAYGTTKYCSSYLRGQNCPNPNCMFLHEPGEEADSYNRHPGSSHPSAANSTTHLHAPSGHSASSHSASTYPASTHPGTAHAATAHPTNSHPLAAQPAAAHLTNAHSTTAHPAATHNASTAALHASGSLVSSSGSGTPSLGHATPTHASPLVHNNTLMNHPGVSPSPVVSHTVLHEHSSSGASTAGATLTAANTPPTPVWGKVVPQIPAVSKLEDSDASAVPRATIESINADMERLASTKWSFEFVSNLVDSSTKFPPMFSLPMDEKRRIKVFNKAVAELDKLQKTPENVEPDAASSASSSQRNTPLDGTPVKNGAKKHNSQHLLAHLMRSGPADGQPLERQEEETELDSLHSPTSGATQSSEPVSIKPDLPTTDQAPGTPLATKADQLTQNLAKTVTQESHKELLDAEAKKLAEDLSKVSLTSEAKKDPPNELSTLNNNDDDTGKQNHAALIPQDLSPADLNMAHSILNNRLNTTTLNSQPAETLRRVGGDLLQPPAPVTVDLPENYEFQKGDYVDDGPHFDLKNIPKVELTGDVQPSVWSAIEDFSRLREQTSISEKAYSAAKAQTKKRVKKIRV